MASVEIKGFGLTITTILKLKNTLDKILGDDLTVELDLWRRHLLLVLV
jgi:hypothetical protein